VLRQEEERQATMSLQPGRYDIRIKPVQTSTAPSVATIGFDPGMRAGGISVVEGWPFPRVIGLAKFELYPSEDTSPANVMTLDETRKRTNRVVDEDLLPIIQDPQRVLGMPLEIKQLAIERQLANNPHCITVQEVVINRLWNVLPIAVISKQHLYSVFNTLCNTGNHGLNKQMGVEAAREVLKKEGTDRTIAFFENAIQERKHDMADSILYGSYAHRMLCKNQAVIQQLYVNR
jgi:hypothetical protein